jgi:hypothetical protein
MMRSRFAALTIALLPIAAACSGQHASSTTGNAQRVTAASAKDMVAAPATGHAIDAENSIPGDQQGKKFTAGQAVFVAFKVERAPVGSQVRVDWYDPHDVKIGSEAKTVSGPDVAMSFAERQTNAWTEGTYRAEIWIADQRADAEQFSIVPPDNAAGNG